MNIFFPCIDQLLGMLSKPHTRVSNGKSDEQCALETNCSDSSSPRSANEKMSLTYNFEG